MVVGFHLFLVACVTPALGPLERIYWPEPPDMPRFVYEATLRSVDSIQKDSYAKRLERMVTGVKAKTVFAKPYDVAAHGGKIAVTDSVLHSVVVFDIPRGRTYPIGRRGQGVLEKPLGIAMDNKQWMYVADVKTKTVNVYDALGLFIRYIGEADEFDRPVDVAVNASGSRIYVVDAGGIDSTRHRIVVFDAEGNKLREIGRRGVANGEFNLPIQAVVGGDGSLYVLDAGNFRVQKFDQTGEFISAWGKAGRNLGDLARPRGIAVDSDDNVYVTDSAYRNFQIFSPQGQLLMYIGGPDLTDKPGQYALPAGIAVDENDRVFIVDQLLTKVEVIRRLTKDERVKIGERQKVEGER